MILTMLVGCPMDSDSNTYTFSTYTVWANTIAYADFSPKFGELAIGDNIRHEFTSSEWNTISPSLTNEGRHNWTESQIRFWFIGMGLYDQASQETAWLITINHGYFASRTGPLVFMLLK